MKYRQVMFSPKGLFTLKEAPLANRVTLGEPTFHVSLQNALFWRVFLLDRVWQYFELF